MTPAVAPNDGHYGPGRSVPPRWQLPHILDTVCIKPYFRFSPGKVQHPPDHPGRAKSARPGPGQGVGGKRRLPVNASIERVVFGAVLRGWKLDV